MKTACRKPVIIIFKNDDDGFPTVALVFLNRGFEKGPKVKIMPQPVKTLYPRNLVPPYSSVPGRSRHPYIGVFFCFSKKKKEREVETRSPDLHRIVKTPRSRRAVLECAGTLETPLYRGVSSVSQREKR